MTNESRETQELRKIPGWATECVVPEQETWQEEGGSGQPCFVAAGELWASSPHTV